MAVVTTKERLIHVRSILLRPACTALVAIATTTALASVPPSSATPIDSVQAGTGTIKGTVQLPAASRRDVFSATAYVTRLDKPGAIQPVTVSARGSFRAKVAPGLYSVVTSGYARKAPKASASVVLVRSGRTVAARASHRENRRGGTVRISVGRFSPPAGADADARYFAQGLGDLTIVDLVRNLSEVGDCQKDVRVYEDRKYGRYDEALKELKLQTSRHFSPETRSRARAALRNLPHVAPTFRVMGAVTSVSQTSATGQVSLVHIKSGRTVFKQDISSAAPFDLSEEATSAVSRFLCEDDVDTVPGTLSGTFSGSVTTPSQLLTWSGTVAKTFVANDPHTGFAYLDSAHYRTTAATVTWQLTGRCSGGGELALTDLSTDFPDSTIEWRATEGKGWGYELDLRPATGSRAMLAPCPPDEEGNPMPPYNAATLVGSGEGGALMENSDTRGAETNRFSPDNVAFVGSLSINPGYAQSWTWNLAGSGEIPAPAGAGG